MARVSPIPYRIKVLDQNGLIDRNWQQFFQAMLDRLGGVGNVPSNDELATDGTRLFDDGLAQLTGLRQDLGAMAALNAFEASAIVAKEELVELFATPTQAEIEHALRVVRDAEALNLFGW